MQRTDAASKKQMLKSGDCHVAALLAATLGWMLAPTKKLLSFFLFEPCFFGVGLLATRGGASASKTDMDC